MVVTTPWLVLLLLLRLLLKNLRSNSLIFKVFGTFWNFLKASERTDYWNLITKKLDTSFFAFCGVMCPMFLYSNKWRLKKWLLSKAAISIITLFVIFQHFYVFHRGISGFFFEKAGKVSRIGEPRVMSHLLYLFSFGHICEIYLCIFHTPWVYVFDGGHSRFLPEPVLKPWGT